MSRRVVTVVASLLALALVLGGVLAAVATLSADTGSDSSSAAPARPPVSEEPDAGASEPPAPDLAAFYDQGLSWDDCEDSDGNECAKLMVPLDYQDPGGETIELALLKVPARDQDTKVGQLVVNPGGPGAPGTSYAESAANVFGRPLLDNFDIVGFDPRGTGASDPVDCLTDAQLDAYVAGDPNPDTPAEVQAYLDGVDEMGSGCVAKTPAISAHVSTVEAARDMDVLRAALGRDQLDYFGASYGTKLGYTYASLFPTKVGHFVLDGALDPALTNKSLNLGQAEGFETALRAYVENCVEGSSCFLGSTVEEGLTKISDFLDQVDANPLPTDGDRDVSVGNAFYGVAAPLYNRDYWTILSSALKSGMNGDGTLLLQLSDLYSSRGPDGYTDNSTEANYAINCIDDPSSTPPDQIPALLPEFEEVAPTLGDIFAWSLLNCTGVKTTAEEPPPTIGAEGAAPIVVIGTTRDPATPYKWAVALADQLASAVLVSRDGDGHTGYMSGNDCVDSAVEDYLIDDTVPEDGLEC